MTRVYRLTEFGIREILLVECEILFYGIRNTAWGIPTLGIRNPSSTSQESGIQYLESGIHGMESRIQNGLLSPYVERSVSKMWISWIFIRKGVGLILELSNTITSVDLLVQFYPWFNFYLTMNLNQGQCSAAVNPVKQSFMNSYSWWWWWWWWW